IPVPTENGQFEILIDAIPGAEANGWVALDDLLLSPNAADCELKPPVATASPLPTTPLPTTNTPLPTTTEHTHVNSVACDFNYDLCGWKKINNDAQDDLEWQLGSSTIDDTGPEKDHTDGDGGQFLYVEHSQISNHTLTARTEIRSINITTEEGGVHCLKVWYWKNDNGKASFVINMYEAGTMSWISTLLELRSEDSDGDKWKKAQVEVGHIGKMQLGIIASAYKQWEGTIAIDDIGFSNKHCVPEHEVNGTLSCDFEESTLCGFQTHDPWTSTSWTWGTGGGEPFTDHTTNSNLGHKLYIRNSMTSGNEIARLISPDMTPLDKYFCYTFWYFILGEDTAQLAIHSRQNDEDSVELWATTGDHGFDWHGASVSGKADSVFK
ncbi:unnamed protein product, partial [Meganyctiphanes norvegica]